MIVSRWPQFLFLSLAFAALLPSVQADSVDIYASKFVKDALKHYIGDATIEEFDDFGKQGGSRDVIDAILFHQALKKGGYEGEVKLTSWTIVSYKRTLSILSSGKAAAFLLTMWSEDIEADSSRALASTLPVMHQGEFEAGLYMNPDHPLFNKLELPQDFHALTAVSSQQWRPDWTTLKRLNLATLHDSIHFESMLKMVHSQRVDFMLIPFTNKPDLSYSALGIHLEPIPNAKLPLHGSRSWVVSLNHPKGRKILAALNRGIQQMHDSGLIRLAYRRAGVINPRVEFWNNIDPTLTPSNRSQVGRITDDHAEP